MKKLLILILITMSITSCIDKTLRSRESQNRTQYPPEKMFDGKDLEAAQLLFDGKYEELKTYIDSDKIKLNHLNDKKAYSLLMYATIIEDLNGMEFLLKNGADPNLVCNDVDFETTLNHAVSINNYDMINLLLKYKANINPSVGVAPLVKAMFLGDEKTERKMIDFLLNNGADINHESFYGKNIMDAATHDSFELANYFLDKGGKPIISGTSLCPLATYVEYKEKKFSENNKVSNDLVEFKQRLIKEYNVKFPYQENELEASKHRVELYEKLNERDRMSVNFKNDLGEKSYKKNLAYIKQHSR
ncbi:ankyrin repeat domain-containing protein [Empedobacter sedimenti]|uniref:ankyrin repeat domain-containing protein n=1 Tax=Empedobacter sedimenti TaxID=3042610 RepID=UPI0024A724A5|nr:ankyrin repeat domain-containing protein [Empedobacter sedimenti]